MSAASFYLLFFLLLSGGIGWVLRWPSSRKNGGLVAGAIALLLATWLGWQLGGLPVAGFLGQSPPIIGIPLLQPGIDLFWTLLQFLVGALQQAVLGLSVNLALILAFLTLYLVVKLILVSLAWIVHGFIRGWAWLRERWRRWRKTPRTPVIDRNRDALPSSVDFLKATARGELLVLAVVLGSLPYLMDLHPALDTYFNLLFWAGLWILLLELWQWLQIRGTHLPMMDVGGEDVSTVPDVPLDKVYREYLKLHNDPAIGDKQLLFYCGIDFPHLNSAQRLPFHHEENGDIALQLRQRLENYLPGGLLEEMLHLADRYERGGDLLFTETLCGYHFLLLAEFIQHRKNRGEVTLLICPHAATEQVEAALQQQIELHQLRLTHRWAVLGRDTITASTQLDVLICPDSALEDHLFRHLHTLTPVLQRLRLLICLDIQALRLSSLRLALGRLWLSVSRSQVQVIAQAEPYHDMEPQVRYLLKFPPDLTECRLNPQLAAQRYLLVWDSHSARRPDLLQDYFRGYQGTLEMSQLLLLLPWQYDFDVVQLDPENRHDEDTFEHLNDDLLVQYGHQDLKRHGRRYQSIGHVYAAGEKLVYQFEDLYNLPLALDRNSNFSGGRSSLLNVICGNYLLRDYYRACLYGARDPHKLLQHLRPLTVRPRGALSEVVTALCAALKYSHDGRGLTRAEIEEQFLSLAPTGLLNEFGIRADWVNLQRLFQLTLVNPPSLNLRRGRDGEPRYSIAPENLIGGPRYYPVCNEFGEDIGMLDAEDYGLGYAQAQLLLMGGKFHYIRAIDAGTEEHIKVLVRHQESEEEDLRRRYLFQRSYRFLEGARYTEGSKHRRILQGDLLIEIEHLHADFEGISHGYRELTETMRPLAGERIPPQIPLEPPLRRIHKLQNVGHIRLQQTGLIGEADLAKVAFTLCAVMQDCFLSLFPQHHWKLAMVSPQSSRLDPEQEETERFYHQLYPVLAGEEEPPEATETEATRLDLYIFEDADHDLGVVRTLCDVQGNGVLLGLARDYLAWAKQSKDSPANLYQTYGAGNLPECLDYQGALAVLDKLRQHWNSPVVAPLNEFDCSSLDVQTIRQAGEICDFCGVSIEGSSERLPDGRMRCLPCGRDSIDTVQEFRQVLEEVIGNMNRRYHISLPEDIQVRFVDAREIARHQGKTFIPTAGFDPRAVGLAIRGSQGSKTMLLENGAPRLSTRATLAHELTHLWQFERSVNIGDIPQEIVEGQARYVEIDYLWAFGGELLAARYQQAMEVGDDVYAVGYRLVVERCPRDAGKIFEYFELMLRGR